MIDELPIYQPGSLQANQPQQATYEFRAYALAQINQQSLLVG
jgi:hypothetical protein